MVRNVGLRRVEPLAYLGYRLFSRFEEVDYSEPDGVCNSFQDVGRALETFGIGK